MWHDRGHMSIHLNEDTAIYKEALQDTEVGVIIVSDTMGSELRGSRQTMELLAEKGINVIKPMLYEKSQVDFLQLLATFQQNGNNQNEVIQVPQVIQNSKLFLQKQGCKYVSIVGICWGGLIVQKIMSTDESYTTAISVDGLYYDPNFSAKSPALFLIGNEPTREEITDAMEQVMWSNNIVPWDMQRMTAPFGHGFIMSCLAGCTSLNPEIKKKLIPKKISIHYWNLWIKDMMESIPGCKMKFVTLMNESRLKIDQIAGFIQKFSNDDTTS